MSKNEEYEKQAIDFFSKFADSSDLEQYFKKERKVKKVKKKKPGKRKVKKIKKKKPRKKFEKNKQNKQKRKKRKKIGTNVSTQTRIRRKQESNVRKKMKKYDGRRKKHAHTITLGDIEEMILIGYCYQYGINFSKVISMGLRKFIEQFNIDEQNKIISYGQKELENRKK